MFVLVDKFLNLERKAIAVNIGCMIVFLEVPRLLFYADVVVVPKLNDAVALATLQKCLCALIVDVIPASALELGGRLNHLIAEFLDFGAYGRFELLDAVGGIRIVSDGDDGLSLFKRLSGLDQSAIIAMKISSNVGNSLSDEFLFASTLAVGGFHFVEQTSMVAGVIRTLTARDKTTTGKLSIVFPHSIGDVEEQTFDKSRSGGRGEALIVVVVLLVVGALLFVGHFADYHGRTDGHLSLFQGFHQLRNERVEFDAVLNEADALTEAERDVLD